MKKKTSASIILSKSKLTKTDFLDLINGKILALRIHSFIDEETCKNWQQPLEDSKRLSRYSNAKDVAVNRIGMTLFETENKAEKLQDYFDSAKQTFSIVEDLLYGDNPILDIHYGINKIWDKGSQTEELNGQAMNPGIIRSFEASPKGGLPPHMDTLAKDIPNAPAFRKITCQLAANLYINTSKEGGELEIWDYSPNLEKLKSLQNGTYDFIDREKIPVSSNIIQPRIGELILFRSSCIHSVRPSKGGMRTAASCFIGYYDEDKPLTVWA